MRRAPVVFGVGLVAVCGVVAWAALRGSTVEARTFAEIRESPGERVQIYGKLDETSIRPVKGPNLVRFDLIDEKTNQRMPVLYDNSAISLPANFPAASHAKAAGVYDPATKRFVADTVQTKCPSKYQEDGLDFRRREAVSAWKKATGLVDGGTRPGG